MIKRAMAVSIILSLGCTEPLTATNDLSAPNDLAGVGTHCSDYTVSTLVGNATMPDFQSGGLSVAVDNAGNVYAGAHFQVLKVTPAGAVTVLSGGSSTMGQVDGTGGVGGTSRFSDIGGLAVDSAGHVYVAENGRIVKLALDGASTTLSKGNDLKTPLGIAVDSAGVVYAADEIDHRIRKVDPSGTVTVLAGNGMDTYTDGTGGASGTASFRAPIGLAVDSTGTVYVADNFHTIRKVAADGTTTTLAGNGTKGFVDGKGSDARFYSPTSVAVDDAGNVYVVDTGNNAIRRIAPDGTTITITSDQTTGFQDGSACSAQFFLPFGLAIHGKQLFVGDGKNGRIRIIQLP